MRLTHDAVAADGIPAHVTVLYPFVPRDRLTNEVRHAIDYRFDRVGDGLDGPTADALEVAAGQALARHGPIIGRATNVVLMTRGADGRWSAERQFALAERR
jgi:hypothetical protein